MPALEQRANVPRLPRRLVPVGLAPAVPVQVLRARATIPSLLRRVCRGPAAEETVSVPAVPVRLQVQVDPARVHRVLVALRAQAVPVADVLHRA